MKETTKPKNTKQSHLLKRDLAENIAVLPLPTPPAGARGEGRGLAADKFEARNSKTETNSKSEIQETANFEQRTLNFELRLAEIAARRDEPLSLSQGTDTILTLTTDFRLPNV
jgi:hypothetical protein